MIIIPIACNELTQLSRFTLLSLPKTIMSNADLNRLINSEEIQSVIRPAG